MKPTSRIVNWERTYQVGIVVKDIEKAVSYFEALGIGPFREGPSGSTTIRCVYGKELPEARVVGRVAQMGPIEFELMQPVAGQTLQREFLDKHGEGVMHICAYTEDLERDIATMENRGHNVIAYLKLDDGGEAAHFETRAIGGLALELFQTGKRWK